MATNLLIFDTITSQNNLFDVSAASHDLPQRIEFATDASHDQIHVTQPGEGLVGILGRRLGSGHVSFDGCLLSSWPTAPVLIVVVH